VLVSSGIVHRSVWIFDPHQQQHFAEQIVIEDEAILEWAMRRIQWHIEGGVEPNRYEIEPFQTSARRFLEQVLTDCRRAGGDEAEHLMRDVDRALRQFTDVPAAHPHERA
jgi:hypothetical protein